MQSPELEQLYVDLPVSAAGDISLAALGEYARTYGIDCEGVLAPTVKDIRQHVGPQRVACFHFRQLGLGPAHIVALLDNDPERGVLLFDIPHEPRWFDWDEVAALCETSEGMLLLAARGTFRDAATTDWTTSDMISSIGWGCAVGLVLIVIPRFILVKLPAGQWPRK